MTARWSVNLILLLVLGLLGLVIRHDLGLADRPQALVWTAAADLRLLEVERDGEPTIRLERTPDGWRMREPLEIDADPGHLDKLLGLLAVPVERSFPAQSAALAELGLEPVKLRLRLDDLTLDFGGLDPLAQRRYVAAQGLVHLIDDRFQHLLIAPPIDWCARTLLPRGKPPRFATLNGVPLAAGSLQALTGLTAERVEPLTGDLTGEPLQFKFADGSALRFLVSADRRRWSRLDLKLRYVLSEGLLLELDPTALDPTPATPPPVLESKSKVLPASPMASGGGAALSAPATSDPFAPPADPDAPVPADVSLGAPPAVRLRPEPMDTDDGTAGGFGAEPYKAAPEGFGADPFAPDPEPAPAPGPRRP